MDWLQSIKKDPRLRHNFTHHVIADSLFALFAGSAFPFVMPVLIRLGATDLWVGAAQAAPFIGLLFSFYWGHFSEGRPKVPIIVYSAVVARLLFIALAMMISPAAFVGMYVVYQLVINAGGPAFPGLVQKIYPAEFRGRMVGTTRLFLGAMQIAATFVAGRTLDRLGHRLWWSLAAGIGILSALVFARIREPQDPGTSAIRPTFSIGEQVALLGRDRAFLLFLLGCTIMGLGNLISSPAIPLYQVKHLALSSQQLATVSMIYTTFWLSSYPIWGWVIDRLKPIYAVIGAVSMFALANLSYSLGYGLPSVLIASTLFGIGDSGLDLGWNNQVMRLTKDKVSTYSGLYLTFLGLRGTIGPLLGSLLLPVIGLRPIFLLSTVIIIVGLVPFFFVERTAAGRTPSGPLRKETALP
ncbi:MAG: MFS transporter [Bacillota bacterium]